MGGLARAAGRYLAGRYPPLQTVILGFLLPLGLLALAWLGLGLLGIEYRDTVGMRFVVRVTDGIALAAALLSLPACAAAVLSLARSGLRRRVKAALIVACLAVAARAVMGGAAVLARGPYDGAALIREKAGLQDGLAFEDGWLVSEDPVFPGGQPPAYTPAYTREEWEGIAAVICEEMRAWVIDGDLVGVAYSSGPPGARQEFRHACRPLAE